MSSAGDVPPCQEAGTHVDLLALHAGAMNHLSSQQFLRTLRSVGRQGNLATQLYVWHRSCLHFKVSFWIPAHSSIKPYNLLQNISPQFTYQIFPNWPVVKQVLWHCPSFKTLLPFTSTTPGGTWSVSVQRLFQDHLPTDFLDSPHPGLRHRQWFWSRDLLGQDSRLQRSLRMSLSGLGRRFPPQQCTSWRWDQKETKKEIKNDKDEGLIGTVFHTRESNPHLQQSSTINDHGKEWQTLHWPWKSGYYSNGPTSSP